MATLTEQAINSTTKAPGVVQKAAIEFPKSSSTSLYVGDLALDVTEPVLFEHFSALAPVSSVRVCRSALTRESLGYAYVNFQSNADAERAMAELNYSLIKERPCRIMWSQRDPAVRRTNVGNIFIKNLSQDVTARILYETLKAFGAIFSCKIAMNPAGESKGYAFVHFETAEAAQTAISTINGIDLHGRVVEVVPYVPKTQRSGPEWNNLFVKNLPKTWGDMQLSEAFSIYGEIISSVTSKSETGASKGFGFVCFSDHEAAKKAEAALNGKEVPGEPVSPPLPRAKTATTPAVAGAAATAEEKADSKPASDDNSGDATAQPSQPEKATTVKLFVGRAIKRVERERLAREKAEVARRERLTRTQGCNLYVRNIDEGMDDAQLRDVFSPFGTITSAIISRDRDGRSKLFGYVCFSSAEEANKALNALHHKLVQGKPLYVAIWQSADQRAANTEADRRRTTNVAGNNAGLAGVARGAPPAQVANANPMSSAAVQQMAALSGAPNGNAMHPIMQFFQSMQLMQQQQAGLPPGQQQQQLLALSNYMQNMQQQAQAQGRIGAPFGNMQGPNGIRPQTQGAPGFNQMALLNPALQQQQLQQQQANFQQQQVQQQAASAQNRGNNNNNLARRPGFNGPPQTMQQATNVPRVVSAGGAQAGMMNMQQVPPQNRQNQVPMTAPGAAVRGGPNGPRLPSAAPPAILQNARNNQGIVQQQQAVSAPGPHDDTVNFAQQVASMPNITDQKNYVGERLFFKIQASQPEKVGKITGMLLDGMEVSELIHLLESENDLNARVKEALDVLRAHQDDAPKA